MAALYHAQDRIAFAAEGVWLSASEAFDIARDHATKLLALVAFVAVAAAAAIAFGGGDSAPVTASSTPAGPSLEAQIVEDDRFSLSLPAGWEAAEAPDGSAFAATSADGLAETTLWVDRDRSLDFAGFVDQSRATLDEIGTNVAVTDRVEGSSLGSQIVRLEAEVPLSGGMAAPYYVTLRATGPYRYYLATSIQPGASPDLVTDAELLSSTFKPEVE